MKINQTECIFQEAGTINGASGSLMVLWKQNLELKLQRKCGFKRSGSFGGGKE